MPDKPETFIDAQDIADSPACNGTHGHLAAPMLDKQTRERVGTMLGYPVLQVMSEEDGRARMGELFAGYTGRRAFLMKRICDATAAKYVWHMALVAHIAKIGDDAFEADLDDEDSKSSKLSDRAGMFFRQEISDTKEYAEWVERNTP